MKKIIIITLFVSAILLAANFWFAVATLPWSVVVAIYAYEFRLLLVNGIALAVIALIIPLVFYSAHRIAEHIRASKKK